MKNIFINWNFKLYFWWYHFQCTRYIKDYKKYISLDIIAKVKIVIRNCLRLLKHKTSLFCFYLKWFMLSKVDLLNLESHHPSKHTTRYLKIKISWSTWNTLWSFYKHIIWVHVISRHKHVLHHTIHLEFEQTYLKGVRESGRIKNNLSGTLRRTS